MASGASSRLRSGALHVAGARASIHPNDALNWLVTELNSYLAICKVSLVAGPTIERTSREGMAGVEPAPSETQSDMRFSVTPHTHGI